VENRKIDLKLNADLIDKFNEDGFLILDKFLNFQRYSFIL